MTIIRYAAACVMLVASLLVTLPQVHAATLTNDLEFHLINNVTTNWQTVALDNSYADAVPVCTNVLESFSGSNPNYDFPPAVVRIRNITASSFDIRIQGWLDAAAVAADVHCIIADAGVHTLPGGGKFEAHTVLSDKTVGRFATDGMWNQANMEDVSSVIGHTYSNPVVLGQVISYNDNRASVIVTSDCDIRANEPFHTGQADGICVGKHIGQVPQSRNNETIGFIVAETGSGTVNGISYKIGRGADYIRGNSAANVGYTYDLFNNYSVGVATLAGIDGSDGGWAVLYGADPLSNTQIALAIDEEIYAGDTSRNHTDEVVDYWVFGAAELTLVKKVINDNDGTAVESDFKLEASGPTTIVGSNGDSAIDSATVPPGSYTLSESGPGGYIGTWNCVGGGSSWATGVYVGIGDKVVCTLTNDDEKPKDPILTLRKEVVNNHGGSGHPYLFTLTFDDGLGNSGSGLQWNNAVTNVTIPPGFYKLTESVVPGYNLSGIACDGNDPDGADGLKIDSGENVICTYTNVDVIVIPRDVDLEIKKSVSDTTPSVGDVITFTVLILNNGPADATDVSVNDILQPGYSYVPGSIAGGTTSSDASPAGTGLEWVIANLASGSSTTVSFQATVLAP